MISLYSAREAIQSATVRAQGEFSVIQHGRDAELRNERQAFLSMREHLSDQAAERARWAKVLAARTTTTAPRLVHGRIAREIAKSRAQDFAIRAAVVAVGIGSMLAILFVR